MQKHMGVVNIKLLQRGLKKEEMLEAKKYQKWYKIVNDEVRLFANEDLSDNKNQVVSVVDWRNSKADLCIDDAETSKDFYDKYKELKVRLFIKADEGSLYNEYRVSDWYVTETGLELDLS